MGNLKIINEKPLSMVEVAEKLKGIEKRDEELTFRANKTKEYLNSFKKITLKKYESLKKGIENLDIPRLKDKHIAKIIDIYPIDLDSLKVVLSNEPITIKEEDMKKIVAVFNESKNDEGAK